MIDVEEDEEEEERLESYIWKLKKGKEMHPIRCVFFDRNKTLKKAQCGNDMIRDPVFFLAKTFSITFHTQRTDVRYVPTLSIF